MTFGKIDINYIEPITFFIEVKCMDILRYSYPTMLKRSKSLSYRQQVTLMTTVLMKFLVEHNLILINPFNEDGSIKENLQLRSSDLTDVDNQFFKEVFPKWSAYIDRGGDILKTTSLLNGLKKLKKQISIYLEVRGVN
jgi:hypothetical protein